jgi:sugar phosphate isomerase/epimerase
MDEWSGRKWEPVTEERLLRAIDVLVDIAKEHGQAFDPVLETVRQELHDFRRRHRPADELGAEQAIGNPMRKAG